MEENKNLERSKKKREKKTLEKRKIRKIDAYSTKSRLWEDNIRLTSI